MHTITLFKMQPVQNVTGLKISHILSCDMFQNVTRFNFTFFKMSHISSFSCLKIKHVSKSLISKCQTFQTYPLAGLTRASECAIIATNNACIASCILLILSETVKKWVNQHKASLFIDTARSLKLIKTLSKKALLDVVVISWAATLIGLPHLLKWL